MAAPQTGLFFLGRRPWLAVAGLWLVALLASLWLWPVAMLFDSLPDGLVRGIGGGEFAGVACLAASAWCLAPRMPTWERSAPRRPRRWAAWCVASMLVVYAALGPLARWLLHALPPAWLPPNADGQTARSQFVEPPTWGSLLVEPRVWDVAAAGAVITLAIGLLGRVAGTLAGVLGYGVLIWAQGSPALCQVSPYGICVQGVPHPGNVIAALIAVAVLIAAAVACWSKTGGAGLLRARTA
ncbi:MAG: hypothetical protein LBL01_05170 [Bifidobacteriaceae bacterium]|jgi:hypothetical protein|nr:hypothetical protein [Bifidobacteriaceae bacterium]